MKMLVTKNGKAARFMMLIPAFVAGLTLVMTGCNRDSGVIPEVKATGEIVFDALGGRKVITVEANCDWEVACEAGWLGLSLASGTGLGHIIVSADEYTGIDDRDAKVEVRYEGGSATVNVVQKGLDATLLNATESANSYLVTAGAGLYAVKAGYKGNSTTEKTGEWASAELLWQDAKGLVTKIFSNPEEALILVNISGGSGNAVICVKDAAGKILWSWHLWVVPGFDPSAKAFTTPESYGDGSQWTFMDRHLGATVSTPGSTGAFGLLYQWGRKDPFTASAAVTEVERKIYDVAGNELADFESRAAQNGTLALSILNPMVFYTVTYATRDWGDVSNDDFWGGVSMKKTIYDPCPLGWKVPVSDAAGKTPYGFLTRTNTTWENNGRLINDTEWWLAGAGTRVNYTGGLNIDVNGSTYGGIWFGTAGKASDDPEYPELYGQYYPVMSGRIATVTKDTRAQGMSVRCMKE